MKRLILILCLVLTTDGWAAPPNPSSGRLLFADPGLGGGSKSCADCHTGGKGLNEIGAYDDGQLLEMINFCLRDAMNGTMLPLTDHRLADIRAYLRSLTPR